MERDKDIGKEIDRKIDIEKERERDLGTFLHPTEFHSVLVRVRRHQSLVCSMHLHEGIEVYPRVRIRTRCCILGELCLHTCPGSQYAAIICKWTQESISDFRQCTTLRTVGLRNHGRWRIRNYMRTRALSPTWSSFSDGRIARPLNPLSRSSTLSPLQPLPLALSSPL